MVKILIHGGAGDIRSEERKQLTGNVTYDIVGEIYDQLYSGMSALDAVQEAVRMMEDHPTFNAGLGSVMTEDGEIEMDALIIDGKTRKMGGVIGVSKVKNPILLSRKILDHKHILFFGEGAHQFAQQNGIDLIDPNKLITDRIRQRLANYLKSRSADYVDPEGRKYGTVGAVALDNQGNLAAATSTGGTLGKMKGRVGDTPIIGAGTYADQDIAASATGVGEYIMQSMICLQVKYNLIRARNNLYEATQVALDDANRDFGPMGVIVMTTDGQWTASHTTPDLIWAYKDDSEHKSFTREE
jgi:beta-aspartyl-peptidase (threonine type)